MSIDVLAMADTALGNSAYLVDLGDGTASSGRCAPTPTPPTAPAGWSLTVPTGGGR